jgi:hypothetical protein
VTTVTFTPNDRAAKVIMALQEALSDAVRARLSMRTRRKLARRRVTMRKLLASYRALPDFLILGAQRCGTSSLYRYLGAHPDIIPSVRKETEYFSRSFHEGEDWYRAHFALRSRLALQRRARRQDQLCFEATPDYLFYPPVPGRVLSTLPDARFIVLLRDPVERAFSHFKHMRSLGVETLSFEEALAVEKDRISDDLCRIHREPSHRSRSALRYSYVARGRYAEQLERWFDFFPVERFLILDSHAFFAAQEENLLQICAFLGVRNWTPRRFENYSRRSNPGLGDTVSGELRKRLEDQFAEANEDLVKLTGRPYTWT